MVTKNSFSVIIPTYNRKEKLRAFLEAMKKQDYPKNNFEIIISDDGSTDGTILLAKEFGVRYVQNLHHGTLHTLNAGMHQAKNDWIIDMGDDQIADKHFLERCNEWMNNYPDCSVFTAQQIPPIELIDKNIFAEYEDYMVHYYLKHGGIGNPIIISKDALKAIDYLNGAEGYAEDPELFRRLREKKYEIIRMPVSVEHMQDYSLRGFINTARYRGISGRYLKGRLYFLAKFFITPFMFPIYLYRFGSFDELKTLRMAVMHTVFNMLMSIYGVI